MFPYPAFSVGFLFFFPAKVKKLRSPKTAPFQPNIQMPHISCPFQHSFFFFLYSTVDSKDQLSSAPKALARCTLLPQRAQRLFFPLQHYF